MMPQFVLDLISFMSLLFVFAIGLGILAIAVIYVIDRTQTVHAVRRNYPVIGRLRYFFEHLGEFFRQYFFAGDREEMPFNRAQRSWVYRAAKNLDNTVAFGSTRDLRPVGTPLFVSAAFPPLDEEVGHAEPMTIGPCARQPYAAASFFNISGMSYGALSRVAVKSLSRGARLAGIWYNTGEGGLSPFHLEGGCDIVFQMGTAKYGVRDEHGRLSEERLLVLGNTPEVKMIEIKLSQGAKPGKGGILPAEKVTPEIAEIRGIPIGKPSLSPNRHLDAGNVTELLDLINRVRDISGKPTGIKTVLSSLGWLQELFALIHERGIESAPDFITVDSGDGGTGAAPMSLMDHVGLPLTESLLMLVDELIRWDLRDRIKVIASGKLVTPSAVALALCAGADFTVSARGFMFSLGCIQALQCNKNTCPTGVTTHRKDLQRGLVPKEKQFRVANYAKNMIKEVETIAHSCGVQDPKQLGRRHVRIQTASGRSLPLDQLAPYPTRGEALNQAPAIVAA